MRLRGNDCLNHVIFNLNALLVGPIGGRYESRQNEDEKHAPYGSRRDMHYGENSCLSVTINDEKSTWNGVGRSITMLVPLRSIRLAPLYRWRCLRRWKDAV